MRSALIISVALHVIISVIAFQWVSFRKVTYVPREMYNVTLVPDVQAAPPPPQKKPEPKPEPPPPQPEPEPEPEEQEEIPPPPDVIKPKPKPTPKPDKPKPRQEVPKTDIEKTTPEESQETSEAPAETGAMQLDHDFPFAPYINRVRRKIAANWRVPEGSQGAERFCRVYFRIQRDGSVSDVMVEETSELFLFDQAAKRAVMNAAPMPPLPREYRDQYLGVHFSFVFREKR